MLKIKTIYIFVPPYFTVGWEEYYNNCSCFSGWEDYYHIMCRFGVKAITIGGCEKYYHCTFMGEWKGYYHCMCIDGLKGIW